MWFSSISIRRRTKEAYKYQLQTKDTLLIIVAFRNVSDPLLKVSSSKEHVETLVDANRIFGYMSVPILGAYDLYRYNALLKEHTPPCRNVYCSYVKSYENWFTRFKIPD